MFLLFLPIWQKKSALIHAKHQRVLLLDDWLTVLFTPALPEREGSNFALMPRVQREAERFAQGDRLRRCFDAGTVVGVIFDDNDEKSLLMERNVRLGINLPPSGGVARDYYPVAFS